MSEEAQAKKVVVDEDICIGCGGCVSVAPDYFELNEDGKSVVIKEYNESDQKLIEEAITACPVQAITLE